MWNTNVSDFPFVYEFSSFKSKANSVFHNLQIGLGLYDNAHWRIYFAFEFTALLFGILHVVNCLFQNLSFFIFWRVSKTNWSLLHLLIQQLSISKAGIFYTQLPTFSHLRRRSRRCNITFAWYKFRRSYKILRRFGTALDQKEEANNSIR